MKQLLTIGVAALLLAGCAGAGDTLSGVLDSVVGGSAGKAAVALDKYCDTVPVPARKVAVDAINARAKAKVTPFDCDGNGAPDF